MLYINAEMQWLQISSDFSLTWRKKKANKCSAVHELYFFFCRGEASLCVTCIGPKCSDCAERNSWLLSVIVCILDIDHLGCLHFWLVRFGRHGHLFIDWLFFFWILHFYFLPVSSSVLAVRSLHFLLIFRGILSAFETLFSFLHVVIFDLKIHPLEMWHIIMQICCLLWACSRTLKMIQYLYSDGGSGMVLCLGHIPLRKADPGPRWRGAGMHLSGFWSFLKIQSTEENLLCIHIEDSELETYVVAGPCIPLN